MSIKVQRVAEALYNTCTAEELFKRLFDEDAGVSVLCALFKLSFDEYFEALQIALHRKHDDDLNAYYEYTRDLDEQENTL